MTAAFRAVPALMFAAFLAVALAAPVALSTGDGLSPGWNAALAKDKEKPAKAAKEKAAKECSKDDKACNDMNAHSKAEANKKKGAEMKEMKAKKP